MTSERPALRVRTPGDLAALAPHLLGFHPAESLVAIALTGPRRRIGLTVRADLADVAALRRQVVGALVREQATGCALLVCTAQASVPQHPFTDLVADLAQALAARGVEVTETLLVRGGTWWSYGCTADCCPPGGSPVEDDSSLVTAVASEHAYDGRVVLGSREELAASLVPCPLLGPALARRLQAQALDELAAQIASVGRAAAVEAELARWQQALETWQDRPAATVTGDAAALAAGLHLLPVRDEVACWGVARRDVLLGLLGQLTRAVVPPDDAPLLSVLAWVAYAGGNGALAQLALRRALDTDPSYSLAGLLLSAVDAMLPPSEVRATLHGAGGTAAGGRVRRGPSGG